MLRLGIGGACYIIPKIPCIFPASREFGFRDRVARDCLLPRRIRYEPEFLGPKRSRVATGPSEFPTPDVRGTGATSGRADTTTRPGDTRRRRRFPPALWE